MGGSFGDVKLGGAALSGRRVLITGAARGIGAALARRCHHEGARVALLGVEPALLAAVAAECDAPWRECDVRSYAAVAGAVDELSAELGGFDVVVANAGVASALPLISGDPAVFATTIDVNLLGTYHTVRASAAYLGNGGYLLLTSSVAAAVHLPLMGAYSASKAAVEALGNTARAELRSQGVRVGVAYYGELDTDMTTRGFSSEAARLLAESPLHRVTPLPVAIDALARGIRRKSRTVVAPPRFRVVLALRPIAQRVVEVALRPDAVRTALAASERDQAKLTTELS